MQTDISLKLSGMVLLLCACSPSPQAIKDTLTENPEILEEAIRLRLEQNPELLFDVIRSNPETFIAAANFAGQERRRLDRKRQVDESFANPKEPEITYDRVIFGNPDAPVTIVEYADFECPYCAAVNPTIDKILEEYGPQVRVVFKHLPLGFHVLAKPAAKYFEAIAMQDPAKARAFHDTLFNNHQALVQGGEAYLQRTAQNLDVNLEQLAHDLASEEVSRKIEADVSEAAKFGINGTPAFLINGILLSGAKPYENFQGLINRHLAAG
jgi:protein-disulfide isomerase